MGLLDQILGAMGGAMGNSQSGGSPLQAILGQVLGSQQGGIGGLVSQFEQAGLGSVVQSWIGNGQNEPVSPQQLHSVLGEEQVRDMANQAGMTPGDLLAQLSHVLPRAVDGMTPNGKVPDEGTQWV